MINVTPAAASKISELLVEENKLSAGLRVFVQGGGCSGFQYGLMIDEGEGDATTDAVIESHGVKLPWIRRRATRAALKLVTTSRRHFTIKNSGTQADLAAARPSAPRAANAWQTGRDKAPLSRPARWL